MAIYMDMEFTGTLNTHVSGLAPDTGGGTFTRAASAAELRLDGTGAAYRPFATGTSPYWWTQTVATADYQVDLVLSIKTILASDLAAVMARLTDDANFYQAYLQQNGTLGLQKVVANAATALGSTTSVSIGAGQSHKLSIRVKSNQISALWNDVVVIGPITDAAFSAALHPGLKIGSGTSTTQAAATGIHADQLVVIDLAPVNTVAPIVTTDGTPVTGETVACDDGTWTGSPDTITKQWLRNGVNIGGATGSSYLLDALDEGKSIVCRVTATNSSGATAADSNAITPDAAIPLAETDVTFLLSGGAGNTNPSAGIGGAPGSTITEPGSAQAVFDRVLGTAAAVGQIDYRCIYINNGHDLRDADIVAYVASQFASDHLTLALGAATEPAGTNVVATADKTTAPSGVTFTSPPDSASGIALGTIEPGQSKGLWLRRTVLAGAAFTSSDFADIGLLVTELP